VNTDFGGKTLGKWRIYGIKINLSETGSEDEDGLNKQTDLLSSTFGFYYQRISYSWVLDCILQMDVNFKTTIQVSIFSLTYVTFLRYGDQVTWFSAVSKLLSRDFHLLTPIIY
jgi:hypothetical protein